MGAVTGASDSLTSAGSAYVWIYLSVVCCVIGVLQWWRRHNYTRGPIVRDLSPLHLAVLGGATDRAVAASLAALRVAGAVRVVDGSLRQDAIPHELASELDLAVYDAVGRGHSPQSMSADPQVRRLIGGAGRRLVDAGLLLGPRERRLVREASIPVFVVAIVGLAVSLGAFLGGSPSTGVTLLQGAGVATVAGLLFLRVDRLPARTRAWLSRAREEAAFLAPAGEPDWRAHGPETAGLAVAVHGVDVLQGIDPDLLALCTRWHGRQVPIDPRREPEYHDSGSLYSGGPTGPVEWNGNHTGRDDWGGSDWGGNGWGGSGGGWSGGDGGGGGGDGGGGGGG